LPPRAVSPCRRFHQLLDLCDAIPHERLPTVSRRLYPCKSDRTITPASDAMHLQTQHSLDGAHQSCRHEGPHELQPREGQSPDWGNPRLRRHEVHHGVLVRRLNAHVCHGAICLLRRVAKCVDLQT
ncbi:hypothetical protein T08_14201, partial [Trichinella sp. T8]